MVEIFESISISVCTKFDFPTRSEAVFPSLCRVIQSSHPVCNTIMLFGVIICLISVILLGIDGRFVSPNEYPKVNRSTVFHYFQFTSSFLIIILMFLLRKLDLSGSSLALNHRFYFSIWSHVQQSVAGASFHHQGQNRSKGNSFLLLILSRILRILRILNKILENFGNPIKV